MTRLTSGSSSVYNINYHIVIIPKYRNKCLKGYIKTLVNKYLLQKIEELQLSLPEYEIMPDHIHLFIKGNPKINISKIVQEIKGYISFNIRRDIKDLQKYKCFWSRGYFVETIGHISETTVKKYIQNQWKYYKP